MGKIYTPATIAEIVRRASDGAGARAIANDLGLKVTSLRVKCSQLGISLRKCRASRAAALEEQAASSSPPASGAGATHQVSSSRPSYATHAHFANGALPLAAVSATPARPKPAVAQARTNISFNTERTDVPLVVVVPRHTILQMRQWGAAKGMTAEELAAELLKVIAAEGLYKAILDEDAA